MYEKTAKKIELAVDEKYREKTYDQCKVHMGTVINDIQRQRRNGLSAQWRNYQREGDSMTALRSYNGKFFRNNVFAMMLSLLLWGICSFIPALMLSADEIEKFPGIFCVVYGIVAGIVLLVKLSKQSKKSKRLAQLMKECSDVEASLQEDRESVARETKREAIASRLLADFEADESISVEEIEKKRAEFDAAVQ